MTRIVSLMMAMSAGCIVVGSAHASDQQLLAALAQRLPALMASESVAGPINAEMAQTQYNAARDFEIAVRASVPVSVSCRPLLRASLNLARGNVAQAEGYDRRSHPTVRAGIRRAQIARSRIPALRDRCHPTEVSHIDSSPRLLAPRAGEAFFGEVVARAPERADTASLYVNGKLWSRLRVTDDTVGFQVHTTPGKLDLRVDFAKDGRTVLRSVDQAAWLLPSSARRVGRERAANPELTASLRSLARRFRGYAGIWVHDVTSGRTAGSDSEALFPAASTVKLGVLIAGLDRFGASPNSPVEYDLAQIARWSSNVAANRVVTKLGGTEAAGSAIVAAVLKRLGARSSTYPGGYIAETKPIADAAFSGVPPRVSKRTTSAHDLAKVLLALHNTAVGDPESSARTRLTVHEARLALGWLIASRASGDNIGLFREALPPNTPIAQKHGWLSDARHSAAIIYSPTGPAVIALLTYGQNLDRSEAAALGARVLAAAGLRSSRLVSRPT